MPETVASPVLCASEQLLEGGVGVRFTLQSPDGQSHPAFVVRFEGQAFAYLNRCAHVPMEMDWREGHFFEEGGLYLICATHGAMYEPNTGLCVAGPCGGAKLIPVPVQENGGQVSWLAQAGWHLLPTA